MSVSVIVVPLVSEASKYEPPVFVFEGGHGWLKTQLDGEEWLGAFPNVGEGEPKILMLDTDLLFPTCPPVVHEGRGNVFPLDAVQMEWRRISDVRPESGYWHINVLDWGRKIGPGRSDDHGNSYHNEVFAHDLYEALGGRYCHPLRDKTDQ